MLVLLLFVVALVCGLLAAFAVPTSRVAIGWLGFSFVVIAAIVERWPG